jgi:hypothetical protein
MHWCETYFLFEWPTMRTWLQIILCGTGIAYGNGATNSANMLFGYRTGTKCGEWSDQSWQPVETLSNGRRSLRCW